MARKPDTTADTTTERVGRIERDRQAELARQRAVVDAVHAATHDADGKPKPIVPPTPLGMNLIDGDDS